VKGRAAQRHLAGLGLYDAGDFAGALAEYKVAMQEYQRAGAMQSLTGASLLRDMGTAKTRLYDFTGALENYEEAQSLLEGFGAMGTFDGARLLVNIGATKGNLGDIHGAMRYQQEAVKVMSLNDKERTKPGAVLLGNIGALRAQLGDVAGARVDFAKAEGILAALQLLGSPEGQTFLRQKRGAGF
jgi:tetratricopeptide (TPR) repeat protein